MSRHRSCLNTLAVFIFAALDSAVCYLTLNGGCKEDHHCTERYTICDRTTHRCGCRAGYREYRAACWQKRAHGSPCLFNEECSHEDPRMQCLSALSDGNVSIRCSCPKPYRPQVDADGEPVYRCLPTYAEQTAFKQDFWPISASHIILMFVACVVVLAMCHVFIRLWMQRRETAFLQRQNQLSSASAEVGLPQFRPRPRVVNLNSADPIVSGVAPNSTLVLDVGGNAVQFEEPPPQYDEAARYLIPPADSRGSASNGPLL